MILARCSTTCHTVRPLPIVSSSVVYPGLFPADGSIGGWATYYSGSGFNAGTMVDGSWVGETGEGKSWHVTNGNGSSVSLSFYGELGSRLL